jgi:undecaprenyl-diphosphatase
VSLGIVLGLVLACLVHFRTNFHVVIPGQVYRSCQLDPVTLDHYIQKFHFGTIINLRGPSPEAEWYMEERAVARRHHIHFLDFPVSSSTPLQAEELRRLLAILGHENQTPILIHCQSGVDRSGAMAVACSLLLDDARGLELAHDQLQWRHGNVPWLRSTTNNRAYLDRYEEWLKQHGLVHSREHFCLWAFTIDPSQS